MDKYSHTIDNKKNNLLSSHYPTAEEIHDHLLEMLKSFHQICVDNSLSYYILGGTALGAKRHHGFIPWDDDVDVGMPREDYEKFASLAKESFPDYYELRWYRNTDNSPFQFIKFIDNRTTLIEQYFSNYVEGLYIDVFPLDGANQGSLLENLRRRRIWTLYRFVCAKCSTDYKNNLLKRIAVKVIKLFDLNKMHDKLEKIVTAKSFDSSPLIANYFGAWRKKEIMNKSIFGKPTIYKFEDAEFYGPENIDAYLTLMYGDYMTPPPIEQRTFRHEYPFLDLNLPYYEYISIMSRSKKSD